MMSTGCKAITTTTNTATGGATSTMTTSASRIIVAAGGSSGTYRVEGHLGYVLCCLVNKTLRQACTHLQIQPPFRARL